MRKSFNLIGAIVVLATISSCSKEMYQANWQSKPVVADGFPTEWNLPLRFADVKTGLQYNITNDSLVIANAIISQSVILGLLG